MKEYLIPSNAPLWQPLLAYTVAFAVLCYLAYDRWRAGKHGWTIGLRIEVLGPRVPPDERTARLMLGENDAVIGRISRVEKPWFELQLEEPWRMWRGTYDRVRIRTGRWYQPIGEISFKSQRVWVDVGLGRPFQCKAHLRIWP